MDVVLALALIDHRRIGNNVPLPMTARRFASLGRHLILEFVPKQDSQVQRLLRTRADIFGNYTLDDLLAAYDPYFSLIERRPISGSLRTLLLFAKNDFGSQMREAHV